MLLGILAVSDVFSAGLWGAYLQSLVPESDAVMCAVGVMRFGEGSANASRFLPRIVSILMYEKPSLVFCGGGVFAMWQGLRSVSQLSCSLARWRTVAIGLFSLASLLDAGLESAYAVIPKFASSEAVGCCLWSNLPHDTGLNFVAFDGGVAGTTVFFVASLLFVGLLLYPAPAFRRFLVIGRGASLLPVTALILLAWAYHFLSSSLVTQVLRTHYHRCVFDLATSAPEVLIAFAMFFGGICAVFWGGIAGWVGCIAGASDDRAVAIAERYHFLAGIACLCSIALWAVESAVL